jgi:hypothetical protein
MLLFLVVNILKLQERCIKFIIKDTNFSQIVMSNEFESLDRALIVEIIRRQMLFKSTATSIEHSYASNETLNSPIEKCKNLQFLLEWLERSARHITGQVYPTNGDKTN